MSEVSGFTNMTSTLYEAGLVAPLISSKWRNLVKGAGWCWRINCGFDPMVAYMLPHAKWGVADFDPPFYNPSILFNPSHYWMLAHAGHGVNSYGLGIVAKFGNFFLSQQVAYGGAYSSNAEFQVNRTHTAYNKYIAPLQDQPELDESNVPLALLHSNYRRYSFLACPDRTLCYEPEPRDSMVPEGWGIIYDALNETSENPEKTAMIERARRSDSRIASAIDYLNAVVDRH